MDPNIHNVVHKDLDSNVYKVQLENRGEDTEDNINSYYLFHAYLILNTVYVNLFLSGFLR